jgi:HD-GYP domain-containing protein (c-di-GMP phosphodiesterase class II)
VYLRADQLLAESAGSASGEGADRSHFEAGRELARGAGVPGEVSDWILHTRERFDGDGPGALAGDAIPIESRIARAACACDLALADPSGDATPTERRHRAGEELRSRSGTELDPGVVEALCAVLDRLD